MAGHDGAEIAGKTAGAVRRCDASQRAQGQHVHEAEVGKPGECLARRAIERGPVRDERRESEETSR